LGDEDWKEKEIKEFTRLVEIMRKHGNLLVKS
jgi:hypothetical protein